MPAPVPAPDARALAPAVDARLPAYRPGACVTTIDQRKTKDRLIGELTQARERIADLERITADLRADRKQVDQETAWLMTELENQRRQVIELVRALEQERARLDAIIENAPEGIIVVDAESRIVLANPTADRLLGRPIPVGWSFADQVSLEMTHPDGARYDPGELPLTQAALEGEVQTDLEMGVRRPDGQRRDLLFNAAPIRDRGGAISGAVAVFQDITQRKTTEQALRRRNRDLHLLNRISQALAAVLDLPQLMAQLLEATVEIVGAAGSSVWLWDGPDRARLCCQRMYLDGTILEPDDYCLEQGQRVAGWVAERGESIAVPDVRQDSRFWQEDDGQADFPPVSLLAVPLRVHEIVIGTLEAVNKRVGTFDSSDMSLAETLAGAAAIAIENAQLVEALRQRTDELRARNEELSAFAHTVAHDLKQPLSVLLGYADVLSDEELLLAPDELRKHLGTMGRIGGKMETIIDNLLLLAAVRMQEVELQPLDMPAIVAEVLQRLAPLIAETQARITVTQPSAWPVALGHARWLEEVWVNYVSNACKYGGSPPIVELGATAEPGGMARFWAQDHGVGITPDQQERLFTPFIRLKSGQVSGHGLGLSIVQRIIEKLGGQVGIESDGMPGHGSTFYFTLPAAIAGQEAHDDGFESHQELV